MTNTGKTMKLAIAVAMLGVAGLWAGGAMAQRTPEYQAARAEGLIDVIVSDHDPQDVEAKRQPFADCADGAVGLQTLLSAAMRLVHGGDLSLVTLLRALSTRPADLLGLPQGRLQVGAPADLMVFDPDEPYVLEPDHLHSLCRNTAFDQARLQGVVQMTLVGGRVLHRLQGAFA